MEISIKTYKIEKVETSNNKFTLPEVTSYYFETGIRRMIRITPEWTTWQVDRYNKPEEIINYFITCIYSSSCNKVESFRTQVSMIEKLYNDSKTNYPNPLVSLMRGDLNPRSEEQFDAELRQAIANFDLIK